MFYQFITKSTDISIEKREKLWSFSHFFNKNIGIFEKLNSENLTKPLLTTLLVLNNRAQVTRKDSNHKAPPFETSKAKKMWNWAAYDRKSKKIGNDQELIQSNPTSHPENQKESNT